MKKFLIATLVTLTVVAAVGVLVNKLTDVNTPLDTSGAADV